MKRGVELEKPDVSAMSRTVAPQALRKQIRFGCHALVAGTTVNAENSRNFKSLFAQSASE